MALTRKLLSALGLEDDKIDQVINAHAETVNGLKDDIDKERAKAEKLREQADKLQAVQKELDELRKASDAKDGKDKDYDQLKKEFDDYKAEVERKAVRAQKEAAYKEILKDAGIPEKHYAKILKYSDVDGIELDKDGKAKNAKDLLKDIKEEWGDHVEKTDTKGAETTNPPANSGGKKKMTVEEIDAIKDTKERQRAMLENHELFGF